MDRVAFDRVIQHCLAQNDGWLMGSGKCSPPPCLVYLDGRLMHHVVRANPGTGEVVVVPQPMRVENDQIVTETIRGRSIVVTPHILTRSPKAAQG